MAEIDVVEQAYKAANSDTNHAKERKDVTLLWHRLRSQFPQETELPIAPELISRALAL